MKLQLCLSLYKERVRCSWANRRQVQLAINYIGCLITHPFYGHRFSFRWPCSRLIKEKPFFHGSPFSYRFLCRMLVTNFTKPAHTYWFLRCWFLLSYVMANFLGILWFCISSYISEMSPNIARVLPSFGFIQGERGGVVWTIIANIYCTWHSISL